MYKVLIDGELFCDSRLDDLALINPVIKNKVNSAGSFEFVITKEHPYYESINKRTTLIEVYIDDDSEPIFEGVCVEDEIDFYGQKKIICEGSLSFLNDSVQRQAHYEGLTSRQLLETYINNHNSQVDEFKRFTVGTVTAKDSNDSITCFTNYNSTMKEVKEDLIDDLGGYLRIRHESGKRVLDYLADSPRTAEQTIELGKNLLNYTSNLDTTEVCTVLIPLGARTGAQVVPGLDEYVTIKSVNDGKDYIESESIGSYGRVAKTISWNEVNVPSILKTKAQAYLSDEQFADVVLNITAIDFGLLSDRFDRFRLLDKIRVISPTHGMDRYFMLTEQTLNLNSPEKDTIVLGKNEKLSLSARTTAASIKVEEATTSDQLQSAIANATNLLKGVEGGHIKIKTEDGKPQEILIMDSDDEATATKIWRWNLNGFGYSNNGGRTYGTAITMDGSIVANYITSGTMSCDRLNGGTITGQTISGNTISGGTISGTTISGTTISGNTISGGTVNGSAISGGTISGTTINGSQFNASGVVRRYKSNYSSADVTRAQNITVGNVSPSISDYEKLDLNADGIINISDAVMIQKLINGDYGDYVDTTCPVVLNGSNDFGTIKTKDVAINNGGIITKNISVNGTLEIGGNVHAKDGTSSWTGVTKTVSNPTSIRVVNGIVVSIN